MNLNNYTNKENSYSNIFRLSIENAHIENHCFENIHEIVFEDCMIKNCSFTNIDGIVSTNTDFSDSLFKKCCSFDSLLKMNNGSIRGCRFDTITVLGEEQPLIHSVYDSKENVRRITGCTFEDCMTSDTLSRCVFLKPRIVLDAVSTDNIDFDNCEVKL